MNRWMQRAALLAAACLGAAAAAVADYPWHGASKTLILARGDAAPEPFTRRIDAFRKDLPAGHKVKVVIGSFFRGQVGMQRQIKSLTPLDPDGRADGEELHFGPLWGHPIHSVTYRKGVKDGPEKLYRDTAGPGRRYVYKLTPWKDGKIHGVVRLFYPAGKAMMETPYVNGKREGVSKSFEPDGFMKRSVTYKNDERCGEAVEYWPTTKKLKKVITYRSGVAHGPARQYYDSGKLKMEVPLWEDEFHGIQKHYDEDGKLRKTVYWILDEEVSKEQFEKRFRVPPIPTTRKAPTTRPLPQTKPAKEPGRSWHGLPARGGGTGILPVTGRGTGILPVIVVTAGEPAHAKRHGQDAHATWHGLPARGLGQHSHARRHGQARRAPDGDAHATWGPQRSGLR